MPLHLFTWRCASYHTGLHPHDDIIPRYFKGTYIHIMQAVRSMNIFPYCSFHIFLSFQRSDILAIKENQRAEVSLRTPVFMPGILQ